MSKNFSALSNIPIFKFDPNLTKPTVSDLEIEDTKKKKKEIKFNVLSNLKLNINQNAIKLFINDTNSSQSDEQEKAKYEKSLSSNLSSTDSILTYKDGINISSNWSIVTPKFIEKLETNINNPEFIKACGIASDSTKKVFQGLINSQIIKDYNPMQNFRKIKKIHTIKKQI